MEIGGASAKGYMPVHDALSSSLSNDLSHLMFYTYSWLSISGLCVCLSIFIHAIFNNSYKFINIHLLTKISFDHSNHYLVRQLLNHVFHQNLFLPLYPKLQRKILQMAEKQNYLFLSFNACYPSY